MDRFSLDRLPRWALPAGVIVFVSLFIFACLNVTGALMLSGVIFLLALTLIMWGSIACYVTAFRESVLCGLLFAFIGPYQIYYLATRWDEIKDAFFKIALGAVIVLLGFLMLPFMMAMSLTALSHSGDPIQLGQTALRTAPAALPHLSQGELYREHEKVLIALIVGISAEKTLLSSVNDGARTQEIVPRLTVCHEMILRLRERYRALPPLSPFNDAWLGLKYDEPMRITHSLLQAEMDRTFAIPEAEAALTSVLQESHVPDVPRERKMGNRAVAERNDLPPVRFEVSGDPTGPRSAFAPHGAPPPFSEDVGPTVTLNVMGVQSDEDA